MEVEKLLWALNSALVLILGFFVRMWISDVKEKIQALDDKLGSKVDEDRCALLHRNCDSAISEMKRTSHVHGAYGQAGEVIHP